MAWVRISAQPSGNRLVLSLTELSMCRVFALEARNLDFERAVKVQACSAGDLHAVATDCALRDSTAGTELLRTKGVFTQPLRPIRSQYAVYRAGGWVLIDADRW